MQIKSKSEAQSRTDQIGCFRKELLSLEEEKILVLDDNQKAAVTKYHDDFIARMSGIFDVDADSREKQLSLGMRIASFLGALGLAASVFFLFYQFWGMFSTAVQVFILITAPLISIPTAAFAIKKEPTGYFAKLISMVGFACFVLNLAMLGQIFNITPSDKAFLAWAAFAFIMAYACDARLLLATGIICLSFFLSARTGTWSGCYWLDFGQRPENFFPAAILLFILPSFISHKRFSGFDPIFRVFAMLQLFLPILILSNWGYISYLDMDTKLIEYMYQAAGFIFSAGAIWIGIKKTWPEVVNTGNVFFVIFLYTKFYDWWWDLMPKYLFFLIIGLTSILFLMIFKRLRNSPTNNTGRAA